MSRLQSILAVILLVFVSSWSQSMITPLFVHKDGEAGATGYNGTEKDLLIDGGINQALSWLTFFCDSIDRTKITKAYCILYVKNVSTAGTLDISAISQPITSPENHTTISDIHKSPARLDSIFLGSSDIERVIQLDVTDAVKAADFNGLVLSSQDGLTAYVGSKEGTFKPFIMFSYTDKVLSTQFLSGEITPVASMGTDGDTYLNTQSGNLYKKENNTWILIANIMGPKGDRGEKGEKGEKGDRGEPGAQGTVGLVGEKGDKGDKGEIGPQGPNVVDNTTTIQNGVINFNHLSPSALAGIRDYIAKQLQLNLPPEILNVPIIQISGITYELYMEFAPKISGQNIVWYASNGNDNQIFFYNGTNIFPISNNTASNKDIAISGTNVVWQYITGKTGKDYKIYYWNGSGDPQIISNNSNDTTINQPPVISGSNVAWISQPAANQYEIYFFNGTTTTQVTNNIYKKQVVQISGDNIVWEDYEDGNSKPSDIYMWNATTGITTQITNNNTDDKSPSISGNYIVWQGDDGTDLEIFQYNISTATTIQITNNMFTDQSAQASGSSIAWQGKNGNNFQIFFYNGTNVTQLTSTNFDNAGAKIDGSNIVWNSLQNIANDGEIFYYDGSKVSQITNDNFDQVFPAISGNTIVFRGCIGQIYKIFKVSF